MSLAADNLDPYIKAAITPIAFDYSSLDNLLAVIDGYKLGYLLTYVDYVKVVSISEPYLQLNSTNYKIVNLNGEVISISEGTTLFGQSYIERQMLLSALPGDLFYIYWGDLVVSGDSPVTEPQNLVLVLLKP